MVSTDQPGARELLVITWTVFLAVAAQSQAESVQADPVVPWILKQILTIFSVVTLLVAITTLNYKYLVIGTDKILVSSSVEKSLTGKHIVRSILVAVGCGD